MLTCIFHECELGLGYCSIMKNSCFTEVLVAPERVILLSLLGNS